MPARKRKPTTSVMMGDVEARPGTWEDLVALPQHVKAELIANTLYSQPRPRARHSLAGTRVAVTLDPEFGGDGKGPGGWWILVEPGIRLHGSKKEVAPDVAGWRRECMPEIPEDFIRVVPDWVCEVLSPSNRQYDWMVKRPYYASVGVPWLWFVDVDARVVQIWQLVDGAWVERMIAGGDVKARLPPFDAVELDLARWWPTPTPKESL